MSACNPIIAQPRYYASLERTTPRVHPVRDRDNLLYRNCIHKPKLNEKGKFLNANDHRGPQNFNVPLLPPDDRHWCGGNSKTPGSLDGNLHVKRKENRQVKRRFSEGVMVCDKIQNTRSFPQFQNDHEFEDINPKLYRVPHKVYPGLLDEHAFGDFAWWRSKPEFDWWNVSNEPNESYFRNEPKNRHGDACGESIACSRAIYRVPPTQIDAKLMTKQSNPKPSLAHGERAKVAKYGYTPLNKPYVSCIPRYPLNLVDCKLVPTLGQFRGDISMREQQPSRFEESSQSLCNNTAAAEGNNGGQTTSGFGSARRTSSGLVEGSGRSTNGLRGSARSSNGLDRSARSPARSPSVGGGNVVVRQQVMMSARSGRSSVQSTKASSGTTLPSSRTPTPSSLSARSIMRGGC